MIVPLLSRGDGVRNQTGPDRHLATHPYPRDGFAGRSERPVQTASKVETHTAPSGR